MMFLLLPANSRDSLFIGNSKVYTIPFKPMSMSMPRSYSKKLFILIP